ncbi:ketoacyl-synthetase C-terminal extension domain-containing protein, partial [Nocardiopsis mangrovi]
MELLGEAREWPETGRPRRVGVSSFGVSGTNAHLILEHDPTGPVGHAPDTESRSGALPVVPLVVSAHGESGLREQARRLAAHLADPGRPTGRPGSPAPTGDLADTALSLATTRAVLRDRAVVLAGDREAAVAGLRTLADGNEAADVLAGPRQAGGVGVLFSGQGSQWVGMGRGLYGAFPVFAEAFDEVCGALDGALGGCAGG